VTDPAPELSGDTPLPREDVPSGTLQPSGAAPDRPAGAGPERHPTRISATWVGIVVGLVVLILLLVFILQNLSQVRVHLLWFSPKMPLGVAMLLSAVAGGVVVGIAGGLRVFQAKRRAPRR
jgi:uncharacterized integral membrane protein